MSPEEPALRRAKARLDRLALYPEPVRLDRVRLVRAPLFFRLPRIRRYGGYALWRTILLKRAPCGSEPQGHPCASDDLLTHELCHIWQGQQRRWHMLLAYATTRYRDNPYEREAREAVAATRD
ncbi:MAG: hypothetical protein ACRDN6_13535 [Gaiellaceae bacterium]